MMRIMQTKKGWTSMSGRSYDFMFVIQMDSIEKEWIEVWWWDRGKWVTDTNEQYVVGVFK